MPRVREQQLICHMCGRTQDPPECHGKAMEFDGNVFFCPACTKETALPVCCHGPMRLQAKVRDIRKELFQKL
jgi:hypothetical protein